MDSQNRRNICIDLLIPMFLLRYSNFYWIFVLNCYFNVGVQNLFIYLFISETYRGMLKYVRIYDPLI
jgi:hypothetical protein